MDEAGDENSTPSDGFEPLAAALGAWFEKSFHELPAELRQLVDKHFLIPWDNHSPVRRRGVALRWDIEHHPALSHERNALWKKSIEVAECGRTASNLPLENRTMTDVELQATTLRRLRAEEASIERALLQRAESLGLNSLDDGAWISDARAPVPARSAKGRDYRPLDAPLLVEMHALIEVGKASSPEDAARLLISKAAGSGKPESKVARLALHYRNTDFSKS